MNFKIKYCTGNKKGWHPTKAYIRVMKHVGIAIKEGKEVIFDYQDNWITIEIND